MLFPRLAAMAEVGWTASARKDRADFLVRLKKQLRRYESAGMDYARSLYAVRLSSKLDETTKACVVALESEAAGPEIRYTLDGSVPGARSPLYAAPLRLERTATVKAGVFEAGRLAGPVSETRFVAHKALGRPVSYAAAFKARYTAGGAFGLVDGLRGSISSTDGRWQGFEGDDLEAVIDLGAEVRVRRIEAGFLRNINSWIFPPLSVEFALSLDGRTFAVVAKKENAEPVTASDAAIWTAAAEAGARARYVRVRAKNVGVCPPWHPGAGGKTWLFIDEIVIE
jgi:hexosaminidase